MPRIVLASGSATRRAMLRTAGLDPVLAPADLDEAALKAQARAEGLDAGTAALRLAEAKARAVSDAFPNDWIIGADQMMDCEGRWFDKPADLPAARRQLQALRDRTHHLPTAAVCLRAGAIRWHHLETPRLRLRAFSEAALEAVLAAEGDALLGSVGGYRIEGPAIGLFDRIEGDWFAILGLPLLPLLSFLRRSGALAL